MLGTLHDWSVHVTIKRSSQWLARTDHLVGLCLSAILGRHAGGGGGVAPFRYCQGLLPVDVTDAPALSVEGPRSVPSRILVVLVDGTMAGDTPGRECPSEDRNWRPRAGETRSAGMSVGGGDAGLPRAGKRCPPLMLPGGPFRWCPLGGSPQWVLRNLLAQMAQLLQVAPLAHVGRCLHFFMTFWDR